MNNYDDLLREKENANTFNDSSLEKHWAALEKKIDTPVQQPKTQYRKLFRHAIAIAAVLLVIVFGYTFLKEKKKLPIQIAGITAIRSIILPPLKNTNVPYETFSLNATIGDTLFTPNGSIIIFPGHAVLNGKGETVNGIIEVRTREFNDPFDYSIAGIPMDYDSAGTNYKFISSGMIDISAFQNGELLQVNPGAKPQLNLVSTNKERKTNLYKLDTVNGKWVNKGKDEVNFVQPQNTNAYATQNIQPGDEEDSNVPPTDYFESEPPAAPQKASNVNPVINVIIDPASFKELLVYNGLKFEVIDAEADKVGEDSKTEWDNIELQRGQTTKDYKVVFSAKNRKAIYKVKPVLEGKDFEAAENLYHKKLKEFKRLQTERKKRDEKSELDKKNLEENNKRIDELNKLVILRNRFIEAENIKIDWLNNENQRRRDSAIQANQQKANRAQRSRTAALEQNLIRSFEIDGFGYWNCDQPSLPETQPYVSSFKNSNNEVVTYNTLCIAAERINRIQNYYDTKTIGLIPNSNYFGWAFNATQLYYFTREDFKNALITNNPNTISISMTLYKGDLENYNELKGYIFNVNNSFDISKK